MSFTHPALVLLHLGAFAFFIALAVCGFMIHAGVRDIPVERSSHDHIVPTAGGVGLVAAVGAALAAQSLFYPGVVDRQFMGPMCALAFALASLGLWDDIAEVSTKLKFALIAIVCGLTVWVIGPPTHLPLATGALAIPYPLGFAGAMLWVFVIINTVNFMDGINGFMAGVLSVSFVFVCAVAILAGNETSAVLSFMSACALWGFLPYNAKRKADLFCGDTGSLFIGYIFAISTLYLVTRSEQTNLLYIAPLLILPFLVDVLLTLLGRARAGKNLLSAHRDHLYQRLFDRIGNPIVVTALYIFVSTLTGLLTLAVVGAGLHTSLFFFLFLVGLLSSLYLLIGRALNIDAG
ncbi:MAG TPA: hypothetical protein ENJ42_08985 [Hellea balneolensis]|uniref:Undecaprenyl/decaprenyl-phosphate alpha-N-acetylglucosaminyl 1-phosphate transferase n=1 Tax=Hellea balneolensis TaxID=287478 RepID=A0A7C5R1C2_9PROT|nr:hypothetical protein [Hellea balneolensis]